MPARRLVSIAICVAALVGCGEPKSAEPELPDLMKVWEEQIATQVNRDKCEDAGLLPLEEASALPAETSANWDRQIDGLDGDQVARFAIEYADNSDQDAEDFNANLLYLLIRSAERGSGIGSNEVGASLMYCYNGVARDDLAAATWLQRAVDKRDTTAMYSLSRLHIEGRLGEASSVETGMALVRQCAFLGNQECKGFFAKIESGAAAE